MSADSSGVALRGSFRAIIVALGARRLAELFGVSPRHISAMRSRNSIGDAYWHLIEAEAARQGLTGMTVADCQRIRLGRFPKQKLKGKKT